MRRASDETFVLCYFCALQNNEEKANVNFKHCSLSCGGFYAFLDSGEMTGSKRERCDMK